jgi:cruciform cutting endonuclease 1
MGSPKPWLNGLTIEKLHRLAVSLGVPCSGTKASRIEGIRRAASGVKLGQKEPLSLLSIDMGIRNLAFAHLTAAAHADDDASLYGSPTLQTWRRINISQSSTPSVGDSVRNGPDLAKPDQIAAASSELLPAPAAAKESFEPIDYAVHAYTLIKDMLQKHEPTHILIERQRFRSGGRAAVPEWTIRVGVFEGMLYAVLRTLVQERQVELTVEPMQPTRVNRYWLESPETSTLTPTKRPTGREVKKEKIDLVGRILREEPKGTRMSLNPALRPFADDFVSIWKNQTKKSRGVSESRSKLDDLSDALLQGLAWVDWQNNRRRIAVLGQDAVDLNSGRLS